MSNFLAVATVTATLKELLQTAVGKDVPGAVPGATVTTVRPDGVNRNTPEKGVNIFLYQVTSNGAWRNADLPTRSSDSQVVQRPQVALDLHYLLTFYGNEGELEPQRLLGLTVSALNAQPMLSRDLIRRTIPKLPFLETSNLAEQVELIKFSPLPLNLEELSKLWSVFFQVAYNLTIAYQGTVVLIESDLTPKATLPVRERGVHGATLQRPVIEKVMSQKDDAAQILENAPIHVGHNLILEGKRLRSEHTLVRFDQTDIPSDALLELSETQVKFQLISPLIPDEFLRAGEHCVQVVHQMDFGTNREPHKSFESNPVFILLRPLIIEPIPPSDGKTIRIKLNHKAGKEQRVTLFLNEFQLQPTPEPAHAYNFNVPQRKQDADTLDISISGVAEKTYLVRVEIDGAESPLKTDTNPNSPTYGKYVGPTVTVGQAPPVVELHSSNIELDVKTRDGDNVTVEGRVTAKNDKGQMVPNAQVTIKWTPPTGPTLTRTATTNANGIATFTISGQNGIYKIEVENISITGAHQFNRNIGEPEDSIDTRLKLLRVAAITLQVVNEQNDNVTIRGVVMVKDESGNSVPDAGVTIKWTIPNRPPESSTAKTDQNGHAVFTIANGRGVYTLEVTNIAKTDYSFDRSGDLSKSIDVSINRLRSTDVELFVLKGEAKVRARVTVSDENDAPVEGATVVATWTLPDNTHVEQTGTSNVNGNATFIIPQGDGQHTLEVTNLSKAGYSFDQAGSIYLEGGLDTSGNKMRCTDIIFIPPSPGFDRLRGRVKVRDKFGETIGGAAVTATWTTPSGTVPPQTLTTSPQGNADFAIRPTASGAYRLDVQNITHADYIFDDKNSKLLSNTYEFG